MLFNVLDWMCGSEKDNIVIFVTLIVKVKSHLCAQSIYEGQVGGVLHNSERKATGIAPSYLHHHCQQRLISNQTFANHLFVNVKARDIILRRSKIWLIKLRTCRGSNRILGSTSYLPHTFHVYSSILTAGHTIASYD